MEMNIDIMSAHYAGENQGRTSDGDGENRHHRWQLGAFWLFNDILNVPLPVGILGF
jgi:hypothetical protein